MRKLYLSILIYFFALNVFSQSKEAVQYNDKLVSFSSPIIENINSLNTQLLELTLKKEHNLLIESEIEDFRIQTTTVIAVKYISAFL